MFRPVLASFARHAGPITLRYHRYLATTAEFAATLPTDLPPPAVDSAEEVLDEDVMPENVSFEEEEEVRQQVENASNTSGRESEYIYPSSRGPIDAARLHEKPSRLTDPIILPLSSLASDSPLLAAASVRCTLIQSDRRSYQTRVWLYLYHPKSSLCLYGRISFIAVSSGTALRCVKYVAPSQRQV
jgi:hypothetical protein